MEELLLIFENISSTSRSLILISGITFFWIIEGLIPLRNLKYNKWKHSIPNFFFTLTTVLVNFLFAFLLVYASDWAFKNQVGVLNYIELNIILKIIVGLLILDLIGAYLSHLFQHQIKPLWYIHSVHHTDHNVDTTTANRHHPIESVIRFVFTFAAIIICGAPIGLVLMYQSISVILSQFNHANISLPTKVDKIISYIIVSPDMHKVHHHFELPHTDSNYGNIFSIWDRIFGTYTELDKKDIIYGVDTDFDEIKNSKILSLLYKPFEKNFK